MSDENPLKTSISKRLEEERYSIPKEKKEKKLLNVQLIVILSIVLGLLFTLVNLIAYFF